MHSNSVVLAVIGGTGVYRLAQLDALETYQIQTPYGQPSAPIRVGMCFGHRVAFLARHGEGHALPPHQINYRANIAALQQIGVARVLALNTVGGITDAYGPRVLACPDQLIDYTWGRVSTFCETSGNNAVLHVDFTHPYSPMFRRKIIAAANVAGVPLVPGGCYGVTQGPRLETAAEIVRMRRDGCDLVGMTSMPEAALAREKGMEYACLAIVANWAAGCGDTREITMTEVLGNVQAVSARLLELIGELARG